MSDQEINIAIAEACGWSEIRRPIEDNYHDLPTDTLGILMGRVSGLRPSKIHVENSEPLPNYCNDLNAMHEAEGTLTKQQQEEYDYQLSEITAPITGERWSLLHANARQRAEAFLLTIGKWKEAAK